MHIEHRLWNPGNAGADWHGVLERMRTAIAGLLRGHRGPARASVADGAAVSGGFKDRLAAMCNDTVVLVRDPLLSIALSCVVEGDLPPAHVPAVLCLAHHLVRNAVQHGMEMHLIGAIEVRVEAGVDVTMLEVRDDGWGVTSRPLETVRRLAERDGGVLHEDVSWDCTVTTVRLPAPSTLWRPGLPGW